MNGGIVNVKHNNRDQRKNRGREGKKRTGKKRMEKKRFCTDKVHCIGTPPLCDI